MKLRDLFTLGAHLGECPKLGSWNSTWLRCWTVDPEQGGSGPGTAGSGGSGRGIRKALGWPSRGSTDEEQGYHRPAPVPVDGEAVPRDDKVAM